MSRRGPRTIASLRRLPALLLVALAALVALLLGPGAVLSQSAPSVTGVEVTSDAGGDDTYALGETITITVTFSEAVDVTGTPQLKIDMDPAHWGTKVVDYESGGGTASLTFDHEVVEPNYSTQGIAVLANSLALNGGTVRSISSQTDADLSHARREHDPEHKVDWQLSPPAPEAPGKPSNLGATTDQGSLDVTLDWDDVDGATRYHVRWRAAGPGNELNAGVNTTTSQLDISVAGYGQWVARVQACNDAGCGKPLTRKFRVEPAPEPTPEATLETKPKTRTEPSPKPAPGLDVSISASPTSPEVNQYATLSATIANIPFDSGWPTYDWQVQQSDGAWHSAWSGQTFSFSSNSPTSIAFRLTVSYESGISDTSDPLTVTWTGDPPPPITIDPGPETVIKTLEVPTADCELAPPERVSALGVAKAAVAFWQAPSDEDACEPVGYLFEARSVDGGAWRSEFVRAEARSHVLDGLTPGQVEYHVTTIYPTGGSDRPLALPQITVPEACDITLTVEADVDSGISGTWTNVAGTPSGCVFGPEIEFQFKQSTWDHFRNYGRYPNSQQSDDSFISYDLTPGVTYDFKIVAVDAAGRTNESNVASATVVYDADAVATSDSPRNVRVVPHNRGNAYVAWDDPTSVPSGHTLTDFIVQWTGGGTTRTKTVAVAGENETEITGLTDGIVYRVLVVARWKAGSNTRDGWSISSAPFTARLEPHQNWFAPGTPRILVAGEGHRIFVRVERNSPVGMTICHLNIGGTLTDINCPLGTLVHWDVSDGVSLRARTSHEDGSAGESWVTDGDIGGAGPPASYASGGNGTLFIGWPDLHAEGFRGTQDAWEVQRRKQNADKTWPNWTTGHIITDTSVRSHTFTALANGTWQVRVRARNVNTEDHDDDPNTPAQAVHIDGFSSEVHTVTLDATYTAVPGPPTGVVITPGVGSLIVEWEPPTGSGSEVYAYQVRHRRGDYAFGDGGGSWTQSSELHPRQVERICRAQGFETNKGEPACINPRSYVIPNLIGGRDYDVAIRAKNANGWGNWLPVGEFNLPNGFPPVLQSAAVNGITLTLTFDRSLDIDSRPSTSVFSVSADGSGQTPTGIGISGNTVTLTLGTAVTSGQTVTVSYVRPTQTPLQHNDAQGPSFTNFSVTNNTP